MSMAQAVQTRVTLKCDCCAHGVGMATQEGDRLIIKRRDHGKDHILVVMLDKQPKPC